MEETLPRSPESISITQQDLQRQPNMCTLTVTTPSPHSMFRNEYSWDSTRPSLELSRPRAENKAVSLPSIRQTFPELNLDGSLPEPHANRMPVPRQTSASVPGSRDTSEYVHSPNSKRRRISIDDEQSSLRAKQVPRLYRSPERPTSRQLASPRQEHALPGAPGSWTRSPRGDSYGRSNLSARLDAHSRPESRPTLPALPPPVKTDLDHPGSMQRLRDPIAGVVDRTSMYHAQDYPYAYQQPGRYQSVSSSPARPFDRAPFSAGTSYGPPYSEMARYGNLGGMGMGADAKQRKRRGNLPKETTDKLRAWFVAHLQHPYPTEDEKQELMRQTGLQMNQISNWFINARRRQLPAMINSARVESDATNGRVVGSANTESKILASTEHNGDYGAHSRRAEALPLSDGESAAYDDDMSDGLRKRRAGDPSRESV